ncbi:Formylglycine-generating enzyme, required for sulfatase activity, contains SUMF1/FGE domain [Litoreibacter janthinus]|uniref:Formylglycine-generating enzyme, required for sulfatase activity, contains SUMF1/FGE domain n=2 Tax=Litoreibacter janthinus TaxID=670154 RepID=A0A1I6IF40_9RHOB|nr:Formylglycine-generating enzyme, required for sulfatase activity, contains SUMF1/FGE domain [Litoreibacter janthinus]
MGSIFGSDFKDYTPPKASDANISALVERVLADMVFIPGGSFLFGNVPVPVEVDGEIREELIYGPAVDPDRAPITLDGYYAARFEITNHDFDLYAAANDLPLRPDNPIHHGRQGPYPAVLAHHQAESYCAWLAELTGQPFALPTSEQWEFAARSGGQAVAYATQDGTYDYLEQLYRQTLDDQPNTPHLPDAYPPNPYGLYAMSSNLAEWVADEWLDTDGFPLKDGATGDPESRDRRVWRGAAYTSQASLNSIFMFGAAGPSTRSKTLEINEDMAPYFEPDHPIIYWGREIGARCVVNVASAPADSGFGRNAGPVPDDFPKPFAPLERR